MRDDHEQTRRILFAGTVLALTLTAFALDCPNAALAILCFLVVG